jgi:hypothetical protein
VPKEPEDQDLPEEVTSWTQSETQDNKFFIMSEEDRDGKVPPKFGIEEIGLDDLKKVQYTYNSRTPNKCTKTTNYCICQDCVWERDVDSSVRGEGDYLPGTTITQG